MMRLWVMLVLVGGMIAGCAAPRTMPPPVDGDVRREVRQAAIRSAMDTALTRRARVYDLSWPVLTSNIALCPTVKRSAGIVLADREQLARLSGGLRDEDLALLGIKEGLRLAHVTKASPAAKAGLGAGMMLTAVDGKPVQDPEEAAKWIGKALNEKGTGTATLTVLIEGQERDIQVSGQERCAMAVKVSTSQSLNAHAITGDIVIFTGMIRSLDDAALTFLIAHEAAHLAMGHRAAYVRNAFVSGAVVTTPLLGILGAVADRVALRLGDGPDTPYGLRAIRATAPWTERFEREADYVGIYMAARAGADPAAATRLSAVIAREGPSALFVKATHPLADDRIALALATQAEIAKKRAAGVPLFPEGWGPLADGKAGGERAP